MKNILRFLAVCLLAIGFSFQFNSCHNTRTFHGCVCYENDGISVAAKTLTVSPSHIEDFYSTDEKTGPITADGNCHAVMTLVFRWADENMARTNQRPPLAYEFQSLFGYFPTNLGMEMIKTTLGIYEWEIVVSQAADPDAGEPNRYGVWVKYLEGITTTDGPIICNVSISYNVFNEAYYEEGCERDD